MKEFRKIANIQPNSYAEQAEIQQDDILLSVNGQEPRDVLDYMMLTSDEEVLLLLEESNGEQYEVLIEKEYHESLGIEFYEPLMDKAKHCTNKCVFCFVDQLPSNMRETLYFKDDDWRLSFLVGNYVTLTNVTEEEFQRIITMRISPLHLSIHAIDPKIRTKLLGHRNEQEIYNRLKKMNDVGIQMKCQIVLCPGWNDGKVLDETIEKLSELEHIESLAVVPVGLTQYRKELEQLTPVDKNKAIEIIEQISTWQKELMERRGNRFVFASDEFFIKAEQEVPEHTMYEGYSQYENGVGIVAKFMKECYDEIDFVQVIDANKPIAVLTGMSGYRTVAQVIEVLNKKLNSDIDVVPITNTFFGESITVAGLICGQDIITQMKNKKQYGTLIIPDVMLRDRSDTFLDNQTVQMVEGALNVTIKTVEDGTHFIRAMAK